jgi:hypothetical protein
MKKIKTMPKQIYPNLNRKQRRALASVTGKSK